MDGERVDAAFELTDKCFVDHAVALKPALPAERLRHNMHSEMSLPALPMPGMSGVPVGFIHHVEARGSESLGQLLRDEIAPCHGVRRAGARPASQCRVSWFVRHVRVLTPPRVTRQVLAAPELFSVSRLLPQRRSFVAATSGAGKFWSCHDGGDNISSSRASARFGGAFSLEILQVAARHSVPALTDLPASASWWPRNNAGTDKVSCPKFG